MEKDVQNNIQMAIVQKEQEFSDFSNTIDIGAIFESSYSLNIVFYLFGNYIIYQYPSYYT
jgi:hypothetical protein